jgi:hypothetical protein
MLHRAPGRLASGILHIISKPEAFFYRLRQREREKDRLKTRLRTIRLRIILTTEASFNNTTGDRPLRLMRQRELKLLILALKTAECRFSSTLPLLTLGERT